MANEARSGCPVQIVKHTGDDEFKVDTKKCEEILLASNIRDKPVVVVSVAGAFRTGKSFLLGFLLRYLRNWRSSDWLGDPNTPLEGFSWRGGRDSDTKGILLWSEVFEVTTAEGREVAVVLMDTQGTFDDESTFNECVRIFGLSILMSSVQIYNISRQIQENDLENLRMFIEYGRLAKKDTKKEPFQKLLFLVRDWQWPEENSYGGEGGRKLLEKWLYSPKKQKPELKECREHIASCFSKIECFLMPYPGKKAATTLQFNGQLSSIESDFKNQLEDLVPSVLAPKNLLVKRVCDDEVTCAQLMQYLQLCADSFQTTVPVAETMFKVGASFKNMQAAEQSLDVYTEGMKALWGEDVLSLSVEEIGKDHEWLKECALRNFDQSPKLCDEDIANSFKTTLTKKIQDWFENMAQEKYTKATHAQENPNRLVTVGSACAIAPIPVVGPLVLLGMAFRDLATSDAERAKLREINNRRELTRTMLQSRYGH